MKLTKEQIKEINDKYLDRMQECEECEDTEIAHMDADELIIEILNDMGLEDIANSFEDTEKWYG